MNLRFVTRQVHAYLDYPVAVGLMALPFVLGLGVSNPFAKWLSVVTGAAAFVLTVLTNHELGVIKVLPYRFHLAVDRMVGAIFALAPIVLGFTGLDAAYYWANAAALLAVTFLFNSPERATLSSQAASSGVAKASVMAQRQAAIELPQSDLARGSCDHGSGPRQPAMDCSPASGRAAA